MSGDVVGRLRETCAGGPECKCTLNEAASVITSQAAEIERLKETVRLHKVWDFPADIQALTVRAETAERLLAEARAALEPFGGYAVTSIHHEDGQWVIRIPDNAPQPAFSHFTAARTLTNGGENGRQGEADRQPIPALVLPRPVERAAPQAVFSRWPASGRDRWNARLPDGCAEKCPRGPLPTDRIRGDRRMSTNPIDPYTWVGFVVCWTIIIQFAQGCVEELFSVPPLAAQLVLFAIVAALYGAYKIWEALEWRS